MDKKKVVVVGAGITGLTAAYRLLKSKENFEVIVLESEKQTGGKLKTSRFAGFLLDEGADAFLARAPWAKSLFDEIGISKEFVSPRSRSASIWINGSLEPRATTVFPVPGPPCTATTPEIGARIISSCSP